MSPERMRRASSSIRSTVGCGSLGTGAVGPDVGVAMLPRWGWSSDVRQAYVRAGYAHPTTPQTRRWFLQGTSPKGLNPIWCSPSRSAVHDDGAPLCRHAHPRSHPRHRRPSPVRRTAVHSGRSPRARTATDNRRDMIARPYRAADIDMRGSAGRSVAIRAAVLAVLAEVSQTQGHRCGARGDAPRRPVPPSAHVGPASRESTVSRRGRPWT